MRRPRPRRWRCSKTPEAKALGCHRSSPVDAVPFDGRSLVTTGPKGCRRCRRRVFRTGSTRGRRGVVLRKVPLFFLSAELPARRVDEARGRAGEGARRRRHLEVAGVGDGEDARRRGRGLPEPPARSRPVRLRVGRRDGGAGARGGSGGQRRRGDCDGREPGRRARGARRRRMYGRDGRVVDGVSARAGGARVVGGEAGPSERDIAQASRAQCASATRTRG